MFVRYISLLIIVSNFLSGCDLDNGIQGTLGNSKKPNYTPILQVETSGDGTGIPVNGSVDVEVQQAFEMFAVERDEKGEFKKNVEVAWVLNGEHAELIIKANGKRAQLSPNSVGYVEVKARSEIGEVVLDFHITPDNPDPLSFTTLTNQTLSTLVTSDIVHITGLDTPADISITGSGSPEYRLCTDGSSGANCTASVTQNWTSLPMLGIVNNNEYIQLRQTTSALNSSSSTATVTISSLNSGWTVTTEGTADITPNVFDFLDLTDVNLNNLETSNIVQVTGIDAAVDVSISGGGSPEYRICTDGSSVANCDASETQTWTSGSTISSLLNNDFIQLRLTSSATNSTTLQAIVNVGNGSVNWDVTTLADLIPTTFSFTDQTDVALSTLTASDIVQITGLTGGADISISGDGSPEYRVCDSSDCSSEVQTWGASAGTGVVLNNYYVQVRLTSNAANATTHTATLNVGGISDNFDVTTLADTVPNAFSFTDQIDVNLSALTTSNIVQISGLGAGADISISGDGSPEYRVCDSSDCSSEVQTWGTGAGTGVVLNNHYVQVRLTSNAGNSTTNTATLNIGGVSDNFDVTTLVDAVPNPFIFTDQTGVATTTLITSNIVQISGLATGADIDISGDGSPEYRVCSISNCSVEVQTWSSVPGVGLVQNNHYVQVRLTSNAANSTTNTATLDVGGVTDDFEVTTIGDTTPVAFNFTDQTDVAISSLTSSNIIQITGINVGTDISISGDGSPEFRVCTNGSSDINCGLTETQTWTSVAQVGLVNNNDYIQIRMTSAVAHSTLQQATLTVGTENDIWNVTTIGDTTPVAFNFTDQSGVALTTLITSNIVQITGIDTGADISVSGDGSPEYRVCDSSDCSSEVQTWGTGAGTGVVLNNHYVQVRLTSNAANSTTNTATLDVGGVTDDFEVTTIGDTTPVAFNFTDQSGVALTTLITSNIVQITGIDTGADISVSGDGTPEYRVCDSSDCSSEVQTWGTGAGTGVVLNNYYIQLRLTSSGSNGTASNAILTVGGTNDTWVVTTFTPNDNTPDAFDFTDQTGVNLSTLTTSDIVQITGIDVGVNISVSGAGSPEYRVCDSSDCSSEVQTWGTSAGTGVVLNNYYVQVRLTSNAANSTTNQATLNVGTGSATWDVTTLNDTIPNAFSFTDQNGVNLSTLTTSNIVQITGLEAGADIDISGDGTPEYRVCDSSDCSSEVQTWGTSPGTGVVLNNYYVQVRLTSNAANATINTATLYIGGVTDDFDVTTLDDTIPNAFSFTDQNGVNLSTLTTSNIVQITGLGAGADIDISGDGTPEYRVCDSSDCSSEVQTWGSSPGTGVVNNNHYVQIRLTSSASNSTLLQAALTVGGTTSSNWNVTTIGDTTPLAFSFVDLSAVAPSVLVDSNIVQITGIDSAADISVSGAGSPEYRVCSSSDCSSEVQTWQAGASVNLVQNNYYVQVRLTSHGAELGSRNATLDVGGVTDIFSVTTADYTPLTFSFTNQNDVALSTLISSNIVQITGINAPVDISIAGSGSPEYRVCSDAACSSEVQTWGSSTGTGVVNNNHYVQIRLTSSASNSTLLQAALTVGGTTSNNWDVTTIGDTTPLAFSFTNQINVALSTLITSNIVQITGIDTLSDISIAGAGSPQYRVCSDAACSSEVQTWGSSAGTGVVNNNHYVQIRLTSSASNSTTLQAALTVGGTTSSNWDVTTLADEIPVAFNFADQGSVALSTLILSDIVQITGIDTAVDVSVSGDGSPEYRVCSDAACSIEVQTWGSSTGTDILNNNNYVQLRLTSNAANGTAHNATLTVGGANDIWVVTTFTPNDNTPDVFDFTDQNSIALSTLTASNIVQITGIDVAVNISVSGAGTPEYRVCSDAACSSEVQTWGSSAGTGVVNNNDYVQLRLTSSASNSTTLQATLNVGTGSANWDVTTLGDVIPNAFSFTNQTNVALSTLIVSNIVQITGIDTASDISVAGGGSPEYRVCSDAACSSEVQTWGSSAGTGVVNNNHYVQIRLTSSSSNSTLLQAALTVGGTTSSNWDVTTLADEIPLAFNFTDQTDVATSALTPSNILQITGIDTAVDISISGDGSPEFRVCTDGSNDVNCGLTETQAWTSASQSNLVNSGDYVQIRMTSAVAHSTLQQAVLSVGGTNDTWNVTTIGDTTPLAFSFTNQSNVALSTLIASNIVQITGIDTASDISVAGDGSPEYRVCSDAACSSEVQTWGSSAGTGVVNNNHYVQIRLTSSASNSTLLQAALTVGGTTSSNWDVTTLGDTIPNAFAFTNQSDVALSTLIASNIVQVTGIDTASDISIAGAGSPQYRVCSDAACSSEVQTWGSSAGTGVVNNNHYVQIRLTSSASNSTTLQAALTVGGTTSSNWDVTTLGDTIPNAFSFTDQTAIQKSTLTTSNIVQITGLGASANVSVSGDGSPEYRVCDSSDCSSEVQTWGSSAGTSIVANNYYVQVRLTSNSANATTNTATLNIGGVTDAFAVTTRTPALINITDFSDPFTPFNFGSIAVGTTERHILKLTNNGEEVASLMGDGLALATPYTYGNNQPYPGYMGSCSLFLAPSTDCYVTIDYSPQTATIHNDTLEITYNDGVQSQTASANLTGTGIIADITPDAFGFVDQGGVAKSTLITSDIIQITGIAADVDISISGNGSPQYRVCSNSDCSSLKTIWTDKMNPSTVSNNNYVQVRLTSAATDYTNYSATLTVGDVNSTSWNVTTTADVHPNAFTFTDLVNQPYSTLIESEILQITGIDTSVDISISGDGAPEYRVCDSSDCSNEVQTWSSNIGTGLIQNNFYVQVRLTTAGTATTRNVTLNVGTASDNWSVTSADTAILVISEAPIYDFSEVGIGYNAERSFFLTNIGNLQATSIDSGTALQAPFAFKGGVFPGTGGSCVSSTLNGSYDNCTFIVRFTPTVAGAANEAIEITYFDGFVTRTATRPVTGTGRDITPNLFSFTNQSDVALSAVITSNIVQITGIDYNADISVFGGGSPEYRVCSDVACSSEVQTWQAGPSTGLVNNNDYVQIRLTSSASHSALRQASLTVGLITSTIWDVTTIGDTTPNVFAFTDLNNQPISKVVESDIVQITGIDTAVGVSVSGSGSGTPWDISTLVYDSLSFNVGSQDNAPSDLIFNNDGTKLYILGTSTDSIYQYSLATPFNISTASYDSVNFVVNTQDSVPMSMIFNSDGTKLYMLGFSSRSVYQYTLSTPYDISSLSYDSVFFSVSAQDTTPTAVRFSNDGSKMYILGESSDHVYQYTLSTPFDLSTANYDTVNFSVTSQVLNPYSMSFNSDGTKMYVIGIGFDRINQYSLATPYNISTASFDHFFSIAAQDTYAYSFALNNNGTKFFTIGDSTNSVHQYSFGDSSYPEYRVCSDSGCSSELYSWRSDGTGSVSNNEYVQLRLMTSPANSTLSQATLVVGSVNDNWNVTTVGDTTPLAFSFTNQSDVALSSLITSNIVQITGIDTPSDISIAGAGSPEYRVCDSSDCSSVEIDWKSAATVMGVQNNYYVQIRLTSSASNSTALQAALTVGGTTSSNWDVTTIGDTSPDAFNFTDQTNVPISYLTKSNIIQITGITTAVDISISGSGAEFRVCMDGSNDTNCGLTELQTWTSVTQSALVQNGDYVQVRMTSSVSNSTLQQTTLTVGGVNDTWNVTTVGDTTPLPFSFTNQTDVALSTLIASNIVQITGIDTASDISIAGAGSPQYRVCSDAACSSEVQTWGSSAGTGVVNNNHYVQIRLTSSGSNSTTLQAALTVGGTTSSNWDVTTLDDTVPDAFTFTDQTDVSTSTLTTSNCLNVTGLGAPADISISGDGSPEFRVFSSLGCNFPDMVLSWTSTTQTGLIQNGYSVLVRLTSNASNATTNTATLDIGGVTDDFDVTTLAVPDIAPNFFDFIDQTDVSLSTLTKSNLVQITGVNQSVDISISGNGGAPYDLRQLKSFTGNTFGNFYMDSPYAVVFKPDGTKMYMLGGGVGAIYQFSLSQPWVIKDAKYDGIFHSFQSQAGSVFSMRINSAGTRILILDGSNMKIHQYNFSTPWDITSLSFVASSVAVNSEVSLPRAIAVNSIGTKLYLVGYTNDAIYQYTMSTPWDVSTLSYNSVSFDISTYVIDPYTIELSSDDSKIYVSNRSPSSLVQFNLGTPSDLTTANYAATNSALPRTNDYPSSIYVTPDGNYLFVSDSEFSTVFKYDLSQSFEIDSTSASLVTELKTNNQEIYPQSVELSADGSKIYVLGSGSDAVHEYNLGTPYDVNTAVFSYSFSILSQDSIPRGLRFSPDGSKMYVSGDVSNSIHQYTLATPWNLSTASYDSISTNTSSQTTYPYDFCFGSGGTKLFLMDGLWGYIYQYTVTTPWNISTMSYDSKFFLAGSVNSQAKGILLNNDGSKFYYLGGVGIFYTFSLGTNWDISTATLDPDYTPITDVNFSPGSVAWADGGSKIFAIALENKSVQKYDLSTNWDISTIEDFTNKTLNLGKVDFNDISFTLNSSGNKLYALNDSGVLRQYNLSTNWLLETSTYSSKTFNFSIQDSVPKSVKLNNDGSKLYMLGGNGDRIFQYTLTTPWELDTISYDAVNFSVSSQEGNPTDFFIKPDGTQLYVVGDNTDEVEQFELGVAWDLSTAYYTNKNFKVSSQNDFVDNLLFSEDGKKMFVFGTPGSTKIFRYDLSIEWDVTSAVYSGYGLYPGAVDDSTSFHAFGDSGNKLYVLGSATNKIYQLDIGESGYPKFRVCNDGSSEVNCDGSLVQDWISGSVISAIDNNQWIQLQLTSSVEYSTTSTVDVNIGTGSDTWNVTTLSSPVNDTPNPIIFTNQLDVSLSSLVVSNPIQISGINTSVDISISGAGGSPEYRVCTDASCSVELQTWGSSSASNFVQNGNYVQVRLLSSPTYSTSRQLTLSVGGTNSNNWNVVTLDDALPIAFDFIDLNNQSLSTLVNSNIVQINGLGVPVGIYTKGSGGTDFSNLNLSNPNSNHFHVGDEDTLAVSAVFNSDGTKMFMVGQAQKTVYQYSLSAPYDVDTASYDSISFSVSAQTGGPAGLAFNASGTKMYITNYTGYIYQYTLSTANNVGTASYDSISFNASNEESYIWDMEFNNDGTKMYILGYNSDKVFQYTLSTPYDISSATYDTINLPVSTQDSSPLSLSFNNDGTKLFVLGTISKKVFQYTLSSAFDVSTATYDSINYYLGDVDSAPYGVKFNSDGTKMLVLGRTNDGVFQVNLSEPFNVSSASYDYLPSFSVSNQEMSPQEFRFNNDGSKLYVLGSGTDSIHQYSLSENYNIMSSTYDSLILSVAGQDLTPMSMEFNNDGSKLYVLGYSTDSIYQYTLSVPYNISTATYDTVSFSVNSQDTFPSGMRFNQDGSKMYIVGTSTDSVHQYSLGTNFDLSTATYDAVSFSVSSQEGAPSSLVFNSHGTKMFIVGTASDSVHQYSLSTPFNVGTASYDSVSFSVSLYDTSPTSLNFNNNGSSLFVLGSTNDKIHQFNYGEGGNPEYRICNDSGCSSELYSWRSNGTGLVSDGNYVQLRTTTSSLQGATSTVDVFVGSESADWNVTTMVPDTTPDAFTFTDQTDVSTSSLTASNCLNITGLNAGADISISGDGSPDFRVFSAPGCDDQDMILSWTSTTQTGLIQNGYSVLVRLTSNASNATTHTATLDIGGVTDDFDVTTLHDTIPNAFAFTDQSDVNISTQTNSNIVQILGITTPVDISISGSGAEFRVCTNGSDDTQCGLSLVQNWTSTSQTGIVANGDYVQVRMTSAVSYSTLQQTTLTVGGTNDTWNVTTVGDTHPNAFAFTNQSDVGLSTLITSNIVQITGIDTASDISIAGAGSPEYRVCDSSDCSTVEINWKSAPSVMGVLNNYYVQIRLTSSASNSTTLQVALTVGGTTSSNWDVATIAADTTPNAFSFTDTIDEPLSTLTASNILQITGINAGTDISVSGDGSPQYRVCTIGSSSASCDGSEVQTWTSTAGTGIVSNNYYVQVRLTSNAANSTMNSATLDIGGVTDQWDVTTIAAPSGFKTWRKIAVGVAHTCGLSADGNIYCWGADVDGELGDDTNKVAKSTPVPIDRTNIPAGVYFTDVEAGDSFTIALASNGKAYGWGKDNRGQIGTNNGTGDKTIPEELDISNLNTAESLISVAAGTEHACGLSSDGLAYCWGRDLNGQNGDNASFAQTNLPTLVDTSVLNTNEKYVQIDVGAIHSCATTTEQRVFCWGNDASGQLGENTDADNNDEPLPTLIDTSNFNANEYITQLTLGYQFSCGITNQANVYCWGSDSHGQLGEGTASDTSTNIPVAIDATNMNTGETFIKLAAGYRHICGITNQGRNGCWGYNSDGQLGEGDLVNFKVSIPTFDLDFTKLSTGESFVSMSLGDYHSCGVTSLGKAYCWGDDDGNNGALGDGVSLTDMDEPTPVDDSVLNSGIFWKSVSSGVIHTCGLSTHGKAYCWGNDSSGQLGEDIDGDNLDENIPVEVDTSNLSAGASFVQIDAGGTSTCGLSNDGKAYCWGDDNYGQLGEDGDGNNTDEIIPVEIDTSALATGVRFVSLSMGDIHGCGLTSDNKAYCWGYDNSGALGEDLDGDNLQEDIPVEVDMSALAAGEVFNSISATFEHTCATTSFGNAYCWGYDGFGRLGENADGDNLAENIPVKVDMTALSTGEKFKTISGGAFHTCALSNLGNAYCWGFNSDGQLGDNSTSSSDIPVSVNTSNLTAGASFVSISSEESTHGCGISSTGISYCWGNDGYGQLGENADADNNDELIPVEVNLSNLESGSNFVYLKALNRHSCGITGYGKLFCWGSDSNGQLGEDAVDGDNLDEDIPVQVDNISEVTSPSSYIFVSSTSDYGDFTLAAADSLCQSDAAANGFVNSAQFKALVSTSTQDAKDRHTVVYPVKKPSGTIVENTDFWSGSNLESPVNEFADGMSAAGLTVFTGSGGFGNYSFDSCSDWSSTGSAGSYGSTDAVNFDWIDLGFATCNTTRHWYCIGPGN